MPRQPPSPTLFPYTTLFRSLDEHARPRRERRRRGGGLGGRGQPGQRVRRDPLQLGAADALRSEEHTSELQSHSDLVCRLLLEKKKNRRAIFGSACGSYPRVV